MIFFEVEMSRATLRLLRKALACVRVSDERFTTDELLHIKHFILTIDKQLEGEKDECNS